MPVEYIFKCLMCGDEVVDTEARPCNKCGGQRVMKNWYNEIVQQSEAEAAEEEDGGEEEP